MDFSIRNEKLSTLFDLTSIFSSFFLQFRFRSLDKNFASYKDLKDNELISSEICEKYVKECLSKI